MDRKILGKYAELLVKVGVNLQKKEMLVISAPVMARDFVVKITKAAYKAGASNVEVLWTDEELTKINFKSRTKSSLAEVPEWVVMQREYFIEKKVAYIGILSDDPENLKGVSVEKITTARRARSKALKKFREYTSSNKIRWSLVGYPNKAWAKKMFPDLSPTKAVEKQLEYIAKTVRLYEEDPVAAWAEHQRNLERRCSVLNNANIKTFIYKSSNGTDFSIDMPEGYIFCGGAEKGALDGVMFTANMPTEEVFSSPDKRTANGTLVAAMPLCRNGNIIKNFKIHFKDGRITSYEAEEGYDNLKSIIETDEGSHYLGEIALVGYNSPIRNLNTLFFETLYDENASCHFAIGDCYPACLTGGVDMSEEELAKKGLNSSLEHVDFMVGAKDLSITAITHGGDKIKIFENGEWTI